MSENKLPPENDPDLLIAEYVLGVLTREESEHVQAMAARDPRYQIAIAAWQQHFAHWLDQVPEVSPPPDTWKKIEQQLFSNVSSQPPARSKGWSELRIWRLTAGALAAALLVSVFIIFQPSRPSSPPLLARLEQSDGNTLFAVTMQPNGSVLFVPTRTVDWQNKTAQAWVIAADGKPRSLGLLPTNASVMLTLPVDLSAVLTTGAVLAVSLEPPNGSPTGLPTGPVIAQGKISSM